MRRAARKDANHAAIAEVLESCGALVLDTSALEGFVDMAVWWRDRLLVEVKDGAKAPCRRRLREGKQAILHARVRQHGGTIHIIETENQALALLGAKRGA